jgi:hypothetical protein
VVSDTVEFGMTYITGHDRSQENFGARISFGYDPEFWRSGPQVPAAIA